MSDKLDPSVLLALAIMGVHPVNATSEEIEKARDLVDVTKLAGALPANSPHGWVLWVTQLVASLADHERDTAQSRAASGPSRLKVDFQIREDGSVLAVAEVRPRGQKASRWIDSDLNWYDFKPSLTLGRGILPDKSRGN